VINATMAILIASTTWRWAGRQSSKKLRGLCGRHGNLESAGDPGRDVDLSPLPEEEPLELRQVGTSGHFAVLIDTSCSALRRRPLRVRGRLLGGGLGG
jgi:hypothetical protein